MTTLHVDLQEGFDGDTVVLLLDGKEFFRRDDVTTNRLVGLAESAEIELAPGACRLEIVVESRDLSHTLALDVQRETFVGFYVEKGRIGFFPPSDRPFGYG